MTIDGRRVGCVAWLVLAIGCGPTIRPDLPPHEPGPVVKHPLRPAPASGRHVALGEMCPRGANDRPAVAPVAMRTHEWNDNPVELANVVERGGIPRFVVFGVDGKLAGVFDSVGLGEIGTPGGGTLAVAAGAYVGASPCTSDAGAGNRSEDPKCGPATGSCGLAVGKLMRPDETPETVAFATGGACIQGDALAVDIDGDKVPEQFPLLTVLDGIRSPANEWTASGSVGAKCTPQFQLYDLKLVPPSEGGRVPDPKYTVGLDVLGVVDVDSDGRRELVLAFKFQTVRTIAVYSALSSPQRLELTGEGTSFPR